MESVLQPEKKRFSLQKGVTFLLLFFHVSLSFSVAQQLSGSYSIGASGDYSTFSDAVSALTTNGISGPVIFDVQSGTFTEQVVLGAIAGASETNTITFQSQSGNAEDVVLQYPATGTADNYVIRFEGSEHIVLNNLKIQALGTAYARTLHAQGAIQNITIEQCILEAPDTGVSNWERGNIVFQPTTSSSVKFLSNTILGGSIGMYYKGGTDVNYRAPGFEFRDNEVTGPYAYGVFFQYLTDAVIEGNTVAMRSTSKSDSY
ncbi:MAG: hypothetical protein HWE15_05020, partial [Algoriphagus sp.]|nr:hypothetical protein [Algoriphagus sp.]